MEVVEVEGYLGTWNQLSWNLFLPADLVLLEQSTEAPFLVGDLGGGRVKRQN